MVVSQIWPSEMRVRGSEYLLTNKLLVPVPPSVQNALDNRSTPSSQSLSSSPRVSGVNPAAGSKNRDSLQRKQLWWLPYVVLEFDKNEVLVDALGGDLSGPVWMYSATFDVSRISDIGVTAYLRTQHPGLEAKKGEGSGQGGGGEGEDMGKADLCLGGLRFTPDLETGVSLCHMSVVIRHQLTV